jgi:hypothetical protein
MTKLIQKHAPIKTLICLLLLAGFSGWQVCDCWDGDDFEDLSHSHFEKNGLNIYSIGVGKEEKLHIQHLLKLDFVFNKKNNPSVPVTNSVQHITSHTYSCTAAFQTSFHSRAPPA